MDFVAGLKKNDPGVA